MDTKLRFDHETTQRLIRIIGQIDTFKGKWSALELKESQYLKEFYQVALVRSVGASARIEGDFLKDEEVQQTVSRLQQNGLEEGTQEDFLGYYEALRFVMENYQELSLEESTVLSLHAMLTKFSTEELTNRGQYKVRSNKVVIRTSTGKDKVIFNTTEPYLVKQEMTRLFEWTNKELNHSNRLHPLLVIGTFVYEMFSIHPFQLGNGQMCRLLLNLLLMRHGYTFVRYASLEHQFGKEKQVYKDVLMATQAVRGTDKEVIDQWLDFLITHLQSLTVDLEKDYKAYKAKGPYLNPRQKVIWACICQNEPVKVGDLSRGNPSISINTIKKDLQYFVKEGMIQKIGRGRGTNYVVRELS